MQKHRSRWVAVAGLAVAGALGVATLRAAGPAAGGGDARGGRLMKLRDDLALTPEQKKSLRQLVVDNRKDIAEKLRPIVEDRRAMQEAATAEPIDEAAVRAAADKLGKDLGDAAILAGGLRKDAAKILSPEQMKSIGDFGEELAGKVDGVLDRLEQGGR